MPSTNKPFGYVRTGSFSKQLSNVHLKAQQYLPNITAHYVRISWDFASYVQKDKSYYVHIVVFWVISHLPDHKVPYL